MKDYLKFLIKNILIFLICGSIYYGIKLICYDDAHIIMFVLAGMCGMIFIDPINSLFYPDFDFLIQIISYTTLCIITECVFGIIVNVIHRCNIWDYSNMQGTFLFGQCNVFFIWIWIVVVIAGIISCDIINYYWIKFNIRSCYKIKGRIIFQFKDMEVIMCKLFIKIKNCISSLFKRKQKKMSHTYIDLRRETSVLDVDLIDDRTDNVNKKKVRQYTKILITSLTIFACVWISWSYILASIALCMYGNPEPLSTLSEKVCEVIIGTVIAYCLKAFFESFAERSMEIIEEHWNVNNSHSEVIETTNNNDKPVG